ncbi:hypothetical protein CERZMDRAFT_92683 [Cercospora zeae-maydis SCOH1-5]|uniref:Uncharacterized protein n=1 Tax=Cercospora zeae-maydis SCOH1-5 TaxID=717836 RepID=A0A6A6FXC1_9PEZI|nr:hypothetical protein CERZMDRAFT_92683 [Cercospora zeae-maydis SCOH1-5]
MAEVPDWPEDRKEDPITITSTEDGSGIGAAIITAMTDARPKKGDVVGIQDEKTRGLSKVDTAEAEVCACMVICKGDETLDLLCHGILPSYAILNGTEGADTGGNATCQP